MNIVSVGSEAVLHVRPILSSVQVDTLRFTEPDLRETGDIGEEEDDNPENVVSECVFFIMLCLKKIVEGWLVLGPLMRWCNVDFLVLDLIVTLPSICEFADVLKPLLCVLDSSSIQYVAIVWFCVEKVIEVCICIVTAKQVNMTHHVLLIGKTITRSELASVSHSFCVCMDRGDIDLCHKEETIFCRSVSDLYASCHYRSRLHILKELFLTISSYRCS